MNNYRQIGTVKGGRTGYQAKELLGPLYAEIFKLEMTLSQRPRVCFARPAEDGLPCAVLALSMVEPVDQAGNGLFDLNPEF